MNILLDTTIIIDILKGDERAIAKIEQLRKDANLYTTAINIYEVLRGIKILERNKEKHLSALRILIDNIYVLPFNLAATEISSDIYAELRNMGISIDSSDYLIAGCCLSSNTNTIITRNEKHFKAIKRLKVINY